MALVVNTNTYISLAYANDYFATRYNSGAWEALDDPTKETLLISATRALDLYCDWLGDKTNPNQKLEFPRDGNDVPESIPIAQCEIAFSILESESVSEESEPNLSKLKADVVEMIFNVSTATTSSLYNDFTNRLLSTLCYNRGASGAKHLTRV